MKIGDRSDFGALAVIIAVIAGFIWYANWSISGGGEDDSSDDAYRETSYIELNKARIKSRLKDPNAAQFRNVYVARSLGMPIVCGEVNARNSFGGYGGYQRFISGGDIQVLESDMAAGEMSTTWGKACGN